MLGEKLGDEFGYGHGKWEGIKYRIQTEYSSYAMRTLVGITAEKDGKKYCAKMEMPDSDISGDGPWLSSMMEVFMNEIDMRGEVLFFKFYKMFEKTLQHVRTDGDKLYVQFKNGIEIEGSTLDTLNPEFLAKCAMVHDVILLKEDENGSSN